MRLLVSGLLAVAACGAPARPLPSPPPRDAATKSSACPPSVSANPVDARQPRRAEIVAELARLDAELDAIDAELAAAAQNQNRSLTDARATALARRSLLDAVSLDDVPAVGTDAPVLLARAVRALSRASQRERERGLELGPKHPDMQRVIGWTQAMRKRAQEQLANERAFTQAWVEALAALPAKAKPDAVYKARLAAMRSTLATPSSESPANVRIAHEALRAALSTHEDLASYAGPRHPEMIAAIARVDAAKTALAAAIEDADAALAARIAAPARAPDGAVIARRAELAENAAALRDEYEHLVR